MNLQTWSVLQDAETLRRYMCFFFGGGGAHSCGKPHRTPKRSLGLYEPVAAWLRINVVRLGSLRIIWRGEHHQNSGCKAVGGRAQGAGALLST